MARKTYFQTEWLDKTKYPQFEYWLQPVKQNINQGYCICCDKTINLSNMGRVALMSHAKGPIHEKNLLKRSKHSAQFQSTFQTTNLSATNRGILITKTFNSTPPVSSESQPLMPSTSVSVNPRVTQFVKKDEVSKAEILWILHVIEHHLSYNSCAAISSTLAKMFTDSAIATQVKLSPSKIAYAVSFGLAPYFSNALVECINKSSHFSACFDESLNKVVQHGQMDIWIRFWNIEASKVGTYIFLNNIHVIKMDTLLYYFNLCMLKMCLII